MVTTSKPSGLEKTLIIGPLVKINTSVGPGRDAISAVADKEEKHIPAIGNTNRKVAMHLKADEVKHFIMLSTKLILVAI